VTRPLLGGGCRATVGACKHPDNTPTLAASWSRAMPLNCCSPCAHAPAARWFLHLPLPPFLNCSQYYADKYGHDKYGYDKSGYDKYGECVGLRCAPCWAGVPQVQSECCSPSVFGVPLHPVSPSLFLNCAGYDKYGYHKDGE
jgi:hypothetical protein